MRFLRAPTCSAVGSGGATCTPVCPPIRRSRWIAGAGVVGTKLGRTIGSSAISLTSSSVASSCVVRRAVGVSATWRPTLRRRQPGWRRGGGRRGRDDRAPAWALKPCRDRGTGPIRGRVRPGRQPVASMAVPANGSALSPCVRAGSRFGCSSRVQRRRTLGGIDVRPQRRH